MNTFETSNPRMTMFAMPKPFNEHIGLIQRNAIRSWIQLVPRPEIILFGNEAGVADVCNELGLIHIPDVKCNAYGTPLMDDMFRVAQQRALNDTLVYMNADIVLFDDFSEAVRRIVAAGFEQFVMIGRRIDTEVVDAIDFQRPDWRERLLALANRIGSLAPRVCKDYFVYRKPLFKEIPPFAIGRAVYDNWFVFSARDKGIPVIEATAVVQAVHQNHGYGHVAGGSRGQAYVKGEEAKTNKALAGGLRLIRGSTSDLILTASTIRKRRIPSDLLQFAADLPRFLGLVMELYGLKKRVGK